jgi:hypothetical protein
LCNAKCALHWTAYTTFRPPVLAALCHRNSMKKLTLIGSSLSSLNAYACIQDNPYSLHYFFVAALFTAVFLACSCIYWLKHKHYLFKISSWFGVFFGVWFIASLLPSVLSSDCSISQWLYWLPIGFSFIFFIVSVYANVKKA